MLRLIYGRGKVYKEIHQAAEKGVDRQILMVPQHYSHEAERKLCVTCGDTISAYCEVLTMKRLANRVFGETGGLAETYLDDGGRLLVMSLAARSVSAGLSSLAGQINRPDILLNLVSLIDEFKTYGVTAEQLSAAAAAYDGSLLEKIKDISVLYSAYDTFLGRSVRDSSDLLTLLADRLDEGVYATDKTVYIDGFTEFTPQEMKVVETLLRKAKSVTVYFDIVADISYDASQANIGEDAFYGSRKSIERLKRYANAYSVEIIDEMNTFAVESTTITTSDSFSSSKELVFLRRNLFKHDPASFGETCKDIILNTAETPWNECEQAAAEILRLCRVEKYRFRDIAVAAPDYSKYSGMLEAVFEAWDIPIFTDRMDNILQKPVAAAVEAAIDVLLGGFEQHDFLRYLKTGLTGPSYDECCKLENYVLAWNIKGRQWTSGKVWTMNPKGFSAESNDATDRELEEINRLRSTLAAPFTHFIQKVSLHSEMPAKEIVTSFYDFLLEVGIDRMIDKKRAEYAQRKELKFADEYAQLWEMICSALDTSLNILGNTPMTFVEFAEMFKMLLGNMNVGTIPVSLDSVAVGDAGRLRHRDVKCVILLGACSGAFPPPIVKNGLLTDENRSELMDLGIHIEPPSSQRMYRELDIAYAILTLPTEKLILSWPVSDRGGKKAPSYLTQRIRRMFDLTIQSPLGDERFTYAQKPCLELALRSAGNQNGGMLSKAALTHFLNDGENRQTIEKAIDTARSERKKLSEDNVLKVYGDKITLTASRADKLRSCKYAYFMQYGIRAKSRFKAGLDALESGSFLHFVLEGTVKTVLARGGFKNIEIDEVRRIADHLSDTYSAETLGGMGDKSARIRFLFQKLKKTARRVAENVAEELCLSEFTPIGYELEFGANGEVPAVSVGEGPEQVQLMGVVDRIDGWEKDGKLYIRVVDYKSGYKKFDLSDIWHGLGLQMLIYLFALEERGHEIYGKETLGAGVLYIPVKDALFSGSRGIPQEEVRAKTDEALRRSGLLLQVPDVVEAMESGKPKRFLPVSFARGGTGYSESASLASLEQLGKLKQHVDMLIRQMGRALHDGCVEADPYYRDLRTNACTYCEFAEACRFDETNGVDKMRFLYKVKPNDFWSRLEAIEYAD